MKLFSAVPGGSHLHYWTQRNITRSLPLKAEEFKREFELAESHVNALTSFGNKAICDAQFYEFGAGWDLSTALSFFALGARRQILVDLYRLARVELINESLKNLRRLGESGAIPNIAIRLLPEENDKEWVGALEEWYGIKYLAPCDARSTGLSSQSVDYVTSTNTLEHIPRAEAHSILRECRRIMRPDGIVSFVIDYRDHYSYADSRISVYNFLKYPPSVWALCNSSFHFQSRMRHSDYLRIARDEGFDVLREQTEGESPESLAAILKEGLATEFQRYESDDLGACEGHIVLRPAYIAGRAE